MKRLGIYSAFIGIVLAVFVLTMSAKHPNQREKAENNQLSIFSTKEFNGNTFDSKNLNGFFVYIQFIDPMNPMDITLFKKVKSQWSHENLKIIAIPKNVDMFLFHVGENPTDIVILSEYKKMQTVMKAPECCESLFFYDPKGYLLAQLFNSRGYEDGIKSYLLKYIKNEKLDISLLVKLNENVKSIEWLQQVADIVKMKKNDHYLVTLITSYCQSCLTKLIIDRLLHVYTKSADKIKLILIVNRENNTEQDLKNMKDQLQIPFPLLRADNKLTEKWQRLIHRYREYDLNNIILLLDEDGKIVSIASPSCNCFEEVFMKIDRLIGKKQ